MNPIGSIGISPSSAPLANQAVASQPTQETSLAGMFANLLEQTNTDQLDSDQAIEDLITGKAESIQQVVMAVAKAEMSFQMFMEIRNRLIESYNELMRMQF